MLFLAYTLIELVYLVSTCLLMHPVLTENLILDTENFTVEITVPVLHELNLERKSQHKHL